ncbi:MAG: VWA domain-containing protein [Acidobacteria bacterium]|nr:VWA domain-containing protein [Acidobacteriota bacterium]MYD70094.1 VWA domain-containing protein [Acidobacteriota bacterium]MYJ05588.1 VWA domain-containing protein [Acidobacteriota bacterium]
MAHYRAACALVLVLTAGASVAAQPTSAPTERQILVSVLDDDGAPVPDLTTTDFEIREDDVPREVLRVEPAGDGRHVILLADTSQAAVRATSHIRSGLEAFVDGMHGDNEIALVTFGGAPRILVPATRDLERLLEGIGEVFPRQGEAAYLLDAIDQVADGIVQRAPERPVIVAVASDGIDYSNRNARQTLDAVKESGASVYIFSLIDRRNTRANFGAFGNVDRQQIIERDMLLEQGPSESGGRHRELLASSALERAMDELVAELRGQYLVTYSRPGALIPPETVSVDVNRPDMDARGTPLRTQGERP